MPQWFWFGIVLALILVLGFLMWSFQKQNSSNLSLLSSLTSRQISQNQTLTNLLLSKDPMTFQQIQTVTSSQPQHPEVEAVNPLDDESVANLLAERYRAHGLDPSAAYAYEDDSVDFKTEFGV